MAHNVQVSTPLFFAAQNDAAEAAINDSFLAAGAANQGAAKTMERPQLILSLRFNRAYQQRERRAYRCWAPVTGGKKHYTNPCWKKLPFDDRLPRSFNFVLLFV